MAVWRSPVTFATPDVTFATFSFSLCCILAFPELLTCLTYFSHIYMRQIHFSDTGSNFHHLFALLFQTLPSSLFAPGHSILSYYRLKTLWKTSYEYSQQL